MAKFSKTERKFPKLTAKQAAYWLSEAWGREISPREVRVRNSWVFIFNEDYPNEVDTLFSPHGCDLDGECWSEVSFEESPFVVKDKQAIKKLTDKLSKSYREYLIDVCHWEKEDIDDLMGASE